MRNIYNIDFTRLVVWLIPPRLRTQFWIDWGKALVSPIASLYNRWKLYYENVDYRLNITGQVCKLEAALNDSFDNDLRRIVITDTQDYEVTLIHTDAAQEPVKTHLNGQGSYYDERIPVIHDDSAYAESIYGFNVILPNVLNNDELNRLKSMLNTYKIQGMKYKILYA